jgi:hypothetical protein
MTSTQILQLMFLSPSEAGGRFPFPHWLTATLARCDLWLEPDGFALPSTTDQELHKQSEVSFHVYTSLRGPVLIARCSWAK